jgi:tRNA G10  N-methylase Trm11
MELIAFFGRQPDLGALEFMELMPLLPFESTLRGVNGIGIALKPKGDYGHDFIETSFADHDFHDAIVTLQRRLGGTVRMAWGGSIPASQDLVAHCHDLVTKLLSSKEGKWNIGISIWGKGPEPYRIAGNLKRSLDHSVRTITAQGPQLNGAQLLHNKLPYLQFGQGLEIVIIKESQGFWVGVTLTSQDIAAYTKRDFGIPKPDAISGMLPPKLAQIMINLAVGHDKKVRVYDPFCGNGRIVMEAAYMGLTAYGSDIVPKKVDSALENLQWLGREYGIEVDYTDCWVADATAEPGRTPDQPYHIVAEPYLGPPLRQPLAPEQEESWLTELSDLYHRFFMTWSMVMTKKRPRSFLMVFPRAKTSTDKEVSVYDALVDRLGQMGYSSEVLFCYDRPDSIVRRDLVKLTYSK